MVSGREQVVHLLRQGFDLETIASMVELTAAEVYDLANNPGSTIELPTGGDAWAGKAVGLVPVVQPDDSVEWTTLDGGDAPSNGTLMQLRRDTAANWTAANPTLAAGEFGLEEDTGKTKIGDGATAWNAMDYYFIGGYSYGDADEIAIPGTTPGFGYGANWNSAGTKLIRYGRDVVVLMEAPPYWFAPEGTTDWQDARLTPVLTFPERWLPASEATDSPTFYESCYDLWSVPGAGRQRVSGFLLVDGEDWDLDQNFHWLEGSLAMCRASTYSHFTASGLHFWTGQYAGIHDGPPPVPYFVQLAAQSRVEFRLPPDAPLTA